MLLPRLPKPALRSRSSRNVCISCLARQHAAYTTGLSSSDQPSNTPSSSISFPTSSPGKPTGPPLDAPNNLPRRRKRRPQTAPQPGPPEPPFQDKYAIRPGIFTTEKSLTDAAIMRAKLSNPKKFSVQKTSVYLHASSTDRSEDPFSTGVLQSADFFNHYDIIPPSIGVPQAPNFFEDYTKMGPTVVPSWSARGAFKRLSGSAIRTARTRGRAGPGGAGAGNGHGLSFRYSNFHVLHPWHAKYLEGSPGIDDIGAERGPEGYVGFPHTLAEVFRRRYAIKNRDQPLWWFMTVLPTDGDIPNSNLVRHKMRYKLQAAFHVALRQCGYGSDGLRLEGSAGRQALFPQMYGTVRVDGHVRSMLEASFTDLVAYLSQAVVTLEGLLGDRSLAKKALGKNLMKTLEKNSEKTGNEHRDEGLAPWQEDLDDNDELFGSRVKEKGGPSWGKAHPKRSKDSAQKKKPRPEENDDGFVVLRDFDAY
ncbi:hypothetical protein SEUCBS139899_005634 [Sporothrix eucalyptigena]